MNKYVVFYGFKIPFKAIEEIEKDIDKLYNEVVVNKLPFPPEESETTQERLRRKLDHIIFSWSNVSALHQGFSTLIEDLDNNTYDANLCIPLFMYYKNIDGEYRDAIKHHDWLKQQIYNISDVLLISWENHISSILGSLHPTLEDIKANCHIINFGEINELQD